MFDKLNKLGELVDKYLFWDVRFARKLGGVVTSAILPESLTKRLNLFMDRYRGIIILFFVLYMLGTAYFLRWYGDSAVSKAIMFSQVTEVCAKNASNPATYFTSEYTVTKCRNLTGEAKNITLNSLLLRSGQCIDAKWVSLFCNCSGG